MTSDCRLDLSDLRLPLNPFSVMYSIGFDTVPCKPPSDPAPIAVAGRRKARLALEQPSVSHRQTGTKVSFRSTRCRRCYVVDEVVEVSFGHFRSEFDERPCAIAELNFRDAIVDFRDCVLHQAVPPWTVPLFVECDIGQAANVFPAAPPDEPDEPAGAGGAVTIVAV